MTLSGRPSRNPLLPGLLVAGLLLCGHAAQALVTMPGYQATTLYSSAGTFSILGGLAGHQGRLYFGQSTQILALDLADLSVSPVGALPPNTDIALVAVRPTDGRVYASYGTSFSTPYPHIMGYLDGGNFIGQLGLDGIYDAAVSPTGQMFLSANPDQDGDQVGDGSGIFRYDWNTGTVTEIAHVGLSTGGLAFDSTGNLYYSVYEQGRIVRFSAAQVAAGSLSLADATTAVILSSPGLLAFDDQDRLYATYLDNAWNTHIALFDPQTGARLDEIAQGGGKLVWADGTLYTIDTDWFTFASTIEAIQPVPEPASLLLVCASATLAMHRRKH